MSHRDTVCFCSARFKPYTKYTSYQDKGGKHPRSHTLSNTHTHTHTHPLSHTCTTKSSLLSHTDMLTRPPSLLSPLSSLLSSLFSLLSSLFSLSPLSLSHTYTHTHTHTHSCI